MFAFFQATLLAGLASAAAVSASSFQTWSGTSCNSGDHLFWNAPSGGVGCQSLGNVRSLRVTGLDGGCSFTYYHDSSCSDIALGANTGDCDGYSDGSQVRSYSIDC